MVKKDNTIEITKDAMLNELYKNYNRTVEFVELKYQSAIETEKQGKTDLNINSRTKKENTDLKEYNQQVQALGVITSKILQLKKTDLPVTNEEDNDEELV